MIMRWIAAVVAFVVVTVVGIAVIGNFSDTGAGAINSWALVTTIAPCGLVAFAAYAAVEYLQTGGFASISRQFDTRTIVLMPLAIAFNIILGQAVGAALKIPIYLDSIGTILVGALAGPIPGALTGFLSNVLWTYVVPPPFHSDIAAPFAVVAAVIGVLAGLFAPLPAGSGRGPNRSMGRLFARRRRRARDRRLPRLLRATAGSTATAFAFFNPDEHQPAVHDPRLGGRPAVRRASSSASWRSSSCAAT